MDKKLKINFIFNFITQLLTVLTPLIISPYISRVFNVDLIGDYNYCYSIVSIFGLFANMGISIYGIPIISRCKESKEEKSKNFFELLTIKLIFAILSTIVYTILIFTVFDKSYQSYFVIFELYILSVFLDISWFFQAIENFRIICIRTIIIKLISFVFIFGFVKDKSDMNIYILINMLALVLPNLLLFCAIKKEIVIKKFKLNIQKHLKPIFELLLPGIAYTFYAMIDKTMLKIITGNTTEVGYYEQAYKIAFIGVTVISVFSTVFSTRISALKNDNEIRKLHQYSYCIISIISIPLFIGLFILADYFIPFYYGSGYEGAIDILKLFAILTFIMGISNFVSYQYFVPKIITKPSMIIIFISILINIVLNLIFIKKFGGFGAALATLIAESFISFSYMCFYARFQKITVVFKTIYKYFISGLITFIVIYIINKCIPCNSFKTFMLYSFAIILLFFGIVIVLKDEIFLNLISKGIDNLRRKKNG